MQKDFHGYLKHLDDEILTGGSIRFLIRWNVNGLSGIL